MVKDSVEIMEQGACSGTAAVPIHYYDVDRMQEKTIESCQGDLTVICNVLADYADMLDEFLQTDRERLGLCGALQYERMRDRCRKTQRFTWSRALTPGNVLVISFISINILLKISSPPL